MATEVDLTYLGRLFINQYVFKRDIRVQRLCCTLRRHCHCCSEYTAYAAPAILMDCPATDLRTEKTPVDTWIKVTDYLPINII